MDAEQRGKSPTLSDMSQGHVRDIMNRRMTRSQQQWGVEDSTAAGSICHQHSALLTFLNL
eukprot:SAG25_NODE_11700_length_298_cov_0.728643_1_plen_59_part_10